MLDLKNIVKKYKTGDFEQVAVDDVSVAFRDSEFVAILGASGSGKTTLLNIIGGLDRYDSGDLLINGISTKKFKDRDWDSYRNHTIGFIFQSYNLIMHQSVLSNVELALTISGVTGEEKRKRAEDALNRVGLGSHVHKKPSELSGGQMQRVAIARALVNNPDIILADEPTGALDTQTSIQVMEILKKESEGRLVIMVTHNPELAQKYATRIITISDGKISGDTHPYTNKMYKESYPTSDITGKKAFGGASMSFFTAMLLSFNNLRTKLARTLLVAFAGAVGIIGIALIMASQNGVNEYIYGREKQMLAQYPLQLEATGLDLASLMNGAGQYMSDNVSEAEDGKSTGIGVKNSVKRIMSSVNINDLKAFKEYMESDPTIEKNSDSVEYKYDITPQIYRIGENAKAEQVNPNTIFSNLNLGSGDEGSIITNAVNTDIFDSLPEGEKLREETYTLKAGKWPENKNDIVLVLSTSGNVSDAVLYTLGMRDISELDNNSSNVGNVSDENNVYSYEDFLGMEFRLINSPDKYVYDRTSGIWKDMSEDENYINTLASNGEKLTVTGVIQRKLGSSSSVMTSGFAYRNDLISDLIKRAGDSDIVKSQLSQPEINIITGNSFEDDKNNTDIDIMRFISIDRDAVKNMFSGAFSQETMGLNDTDSGGNLQKNMFSLLSGEMQVGVSNLQLTDAEIRDIVERSVSPPTSEDISALLQRSIKAKTSEEVSLAGNKFIEKFLSYADPAALISREEAAKALAEFIATDEGKQAVFDLAESLIDMNILKDDLTKEATAAAGQVQKNAFDVFKEKIDAYIKERGAEITAAVSQNIREEVENYAKKIFSNISANLDNLLTPSSLSSIVKLNISASDIRGVVTSMLLNRSGSSLEGNLKKMGYVDLNSPSSINIYPSDLDSKAVIEDTIAAYNAKQRLDGNEGKVISYSDLGAAMMNQITGIINIITVVLIGVVSVSLIVSSLMIGVITYISVLERKGEIGVLRALGASKKNVAGVFNAETFITGLLSGIVGVSIAYLLTIPANIALKYFLKGFSINIFLPFYSAIMLIALSTALTVIAGLIPALKASKSDPVKALRNE